MKKILLLALLTVPASSVLAGQTCNDKIIETTPNSRFTVNSDNTVTDKTTGLIWMRCSLGQSGKDCRGGSLYKLNWSQALQAAEDTNFAQKDDWRMPSYRELSSITETSCHSPSINKTVFPNTKSYSYYSSTPSWYCHQCAWAVNFTDGLGRRYSKTTELSHMRLVRDGK